MKRNPTFICLLLIFTQSLFSQNASVKGLVTDAATKEPLIGVSVRAENSGAVTNTDGNYDIKLAEGKHKLTFSYIGYASVTRSVNLTKGQVLAFDVQLDDGSNLLNTATVTSGKFEKPLGEVTVSLDVIKPKLLQSMNATQVDQAISKIPGVSIIDGQAQIRGGSGFSYGAGTRVLMLVDDMPALQPDAGFPNWSDFPVENISQIEVLKGAASALYGSSAMNGIINIRTGFAKDKPETEAAVWGKITGTPEDERMAWWKADTSNLTAPYETGFSFVHRRKANKLDIVLGGLGLTRQTHNRFTNSDYMRLTPNFRYRVNDRLTIGLNSNFNIGRSGSFFVWDNDTTGAYQPGLNSASKSLGRLRFTVDPSMTYIGKNGNRHKILSRYYYIQNNSSNNQSNNSRNYYGEYQFQHNFEEIGLVLTTGAVAQRSTVDADLYNNANYDANNLAGYLQLDYKPFSRLNLSGGLRYERNVQQSPDTIRFFANEFGIIPDGVVKESKPVFRFGANYQLARASFLRASWGQGYRYPTIAEKFINTDFSAGNTVTPNPFLESEYGWTAEVGLKQGFKLGSWRGYMDITGFVSEYTRMMEFVLAKLSIDLTTFKPIAYFQSQNVGDTQVKGGEITLVGQSKLGAGTLSLLAGYTYIDPKYKVFGNVEKESSSVDYNVLKYRFKHLAKWDSEYEWNKIVAAISYQYFSNMEAIDKVFQLDSPPPFSVPPFSAVKRFRDANNNGFSLVDIRLGYKLTNRLKVSFLCNNLTNTTYSLRPALLESPRNYTVRAEVKL